MSPAPRRQRVAAYAVILRESPNGPEILLSRLARRVSRTELWTLPGGGLDHGEDPKVALLREIWEETGLDAQIGGLPEVFSSHRPNAEFDGRVSDFHALRIVHDAWVPRDAPAPRVMEVNGSTEAAGWHLVADVEAGLVPVAQLVTEAMAVKSVRRHQRVASYGLAVRDERVLLTRLWACSSHAGAWTLPGGGIEHGEAPAAALVREVREETGLDAVVGPLLGVHDTHFTGTAPSGRLEDFHGIHLVHAIEVPDAPPVVGAGDITTVEADWLPVTDVLSGRVETLEVVRFALDLRASR